MYWDSFDCQIQCEEVYSFRTEVFVLSLTDTEDFEGETEWL